MSNPPGALPPRLPPGPAIPSPIPPSGPAAAPPPAGAGGAAPPVDGRDAGAPPRSPPAGTPSPLTAAFSSAGSAVHLGRQPTLDWIDNLLDFLLELITLGFANTRTFNGDERVTRHWESAGMDLMLRGGSELRGALAAMPEPQARARIAELVRRANPGISQEDANRVAGHIYSGMMALARAPGLTDRGLDVLSAAAAREPAASRGALARELQGLLRNPSFLALPAPARQALVAQAINCPRPEVVHNLERLSRAGWFADLDPADQQRAAKVVAFASELSAQSTSNRQRLLIDNTLNHILPPDGAVSVNFVDLASGIFGQADPPRAFDFGRDQIPAGNGRMPDEVGREAVDTLVHEINHLHNNIEVDATFDYLMDEYNAWYLGYESQNGRQPTRQECFEQLTYLMSAEGYSNLHDILRDRDEEGGLGPQARRVVAFMSQFFDPPLDPEDPSVTRRMMDMEIGRHNIMTDPDAPGPRATGTDLPISDDNGGPLRAR